VNQAPNVSVVVNNYNYGRFLDQAIQSALDQTYPKTEVVVVDDGSTDDSRAIIHAYGDRIVSVFKENGGQGSAFNAGFAASHGEVIIFLDADDLLLPTAAERAAKSFDGPEVVKVHWPLWEIDKKGDKTGKLIPDRELPEGNLRDVVLQQGPASHLNPPTTGNAWSRNFLEQVLPMPEALYQTWGDAYLLELAPLFGELRKISEPQGLYRVHGSNAYATTSFDERLRRGIAVYDDICDAMTKHCFELGLEINSEFFRNTSWFHKVQKATEDIISVIPAGQTFILVDENEWGTDDLLAGRRCIPFIERHGEYWGPPPDDETAINEIERLRESGAKFVVFTWPSFWWLEHYTKMHEALSEKFRRIMTNERITVFDLEPAQSAR